MFDKKKKNDKQEEPDKTLPAAILEIMDANVATLREQQAPKEPSALDILREDRERKVKEFKELTAKAELVRAQIVQLDHDITFIELGPENLRILETIARTRFGPRAQDERERETA